jgi:anti-sigma regulatory factor (Ser/Thr protein kinase)
MSGRILSGGQSRVEIAHESGIGECRRLALRLAEDFQFDAVRAGRAGIVATELATNVLRHAAGGSMLLQVLDDGVLAELEMIAIDRGPGMASVEESLRDGHSTAGTSGCGLGAVSRLSDTFDAYSIVGQGTVVVSRLSRVGGPAHRAPGERRRLEVGAVNVAVSGEIECGDTWRVAEGAGLVGILVADGLGHGPLAATAARAAAVAFSARPFDAPSQSMQACHKALGGTRGAAAACALLDVGNLRLSYAGVGNISACLVTHERVRGLVSHNGTLGLQPVRASQFEYECPAGGRVVLHSDGLSAKWNLAAYPGLHLRHSAVMAAVLYRDFARGRDDATLVVVRPLP